jgi:ATP synthase protein I
LQEDSGKGYQFFRMAKLSSVGLEMGIAVALGSGIGYWLDKKFGTKPWLMLVFLLLGVAAGFKGIYTAAREATRGNRESKE